MLNILKLKKFNWRIIEKIIITKFKKYLTLQFKIFKMKFYKMSKNKGR